MAEAENNPYRTPEAPLKQAVDKESILLFKRFTAWGVFGLTIVTIGIYPVYWMYSRATVINSFHENKISPVFLYTLVVAVILSTATLFFGPGDTEVIIGGVITIVYFVVYLIVLFKIRNRLQVIVNQTSDKTYNLSIILTFFFYVIYLQYKINECIDDLQPGI